MPIHRATVAGTNRRLSVAIALLKAVAIAILIKTIAATAASYGDYFPPNFTVGFLSGRESHFFGLYQWAFYAHIVAGPISLIIGALLQSSRLRRSAPQWHRRFGRIQGVCVLAFVGPSGLVMACWPAAGLVAGTGLGLLAVMTMICCGKGWRAAVGRRFEVHQLWMNRMFVLLCSAVVIRVLGGAGAVLEITWPLYDVAITWVSWVVPLCVYESINHFELLPKEPPQRYPA